MARCQSGSRELQPANPMNNANPPEISPDVHPAAFPIGSAESRAAARIRLRQRWGSQRRLQIITSVHWPHGPQGLDRSQPYALPWQKTADGGVMRIVYVPGEWRTLPAMDLPVCPGCGAAFRNSGKMIGDSVWFEADCVRKHIADY